MALAAVGIAMAVWWMWGGVDVGAQRSYEAPESAQTVDCAALTNKLASGKVLSRTDIDVLRTRCGKSR